VTKGGEAPKTVDSPDPSVESAAAGRTLERPDRVLLKRARRIRMPSPLGARRPHPDAAGTCPKPECRFPSSVRRRVDHELG
jgi:hypothetical protein